LISDFQWLHSGAQKDTREENTVKPSTQKFSLAGALVLAACTGALAADFTLTSSAFKDGTMLAKKNAGANKTNPNCVGENVSPRPIHRPGPRAMRC
jgi:hypothetical protein